jgi:hypothetical protein
MVTKGQEEIVLEDMNHTELVFLAKWLGIRASRAIPREGIIWAITNLTPMSRKRKSDEKKKDDKKNIKLKDDGLPDMMDTIESKQITLSTWLKQYWDRFEMQSNKRACPNCLGCSDIQALSCYELNKSQFGGR